MKLSCSHCQRALDFSGERPSFCPYCGTPITNQPLTATDEFKPSSSLVDFNDTRQPGVTPPPDLASPQVNSDPDWVGDYRILRRLGTGGMGAVYEAEDSHSGRKVAVKLIKPQLASSDGAIHRFRQEGRLASMIAHPRCVFVLKADEDGGRPYIVMELMPGATLKDVVDQQGPLPIATAVAKILDVIDGLAEAHALGVIHRDVKPSNCFVMPDGRVKIGDFGLAKSLQRDMSITRTGSFIGTPLFASPEQIKGEAIDFRTDVYSVAATLYYLLTGKAPFEGGDPTATVARIVSEDAPPLQTLRPNIPTALQAIVMKGLERNRDRRWADLEDFRQALEPYLPGYYQSAKRRSRLRAIVTDAVVLLPLLLLMAQLGEWLMPMAQFRLSTALVQDTLMGAVSFLYFFLLEGAFGATVGKWLMRLRISSVRFGHAVHWTQALVRTFTFFMVVGIPGKLAYYVTEPLWPGAGWVLREDLTLEYALLLEYAVHFACIMFLVDTMRKANGYRGLHDLLSGTRVVQLPWPRKVVRFPTGATPPMVPRPVGVPERIDNFAVRGALPLSPDELVLVADDTVLNRKVWLVLQPPDHAGVSPVRREISRNTRVRWLSGGTVSLSRNPFGGLHASAGPVELNYDAFLAGAGCPLPDIVRQRGRLSWAEGRGLLEQLTDELVAGAQDGTLPPVLSPDHLWLQPNGRLLLVGGSTPTQADASQDPLAIRQRTLGPLKQVTELLFEGKPRRDATDTRPLAAPVPRQVRALADGLVGHPKFYADPIEVQRELHATRDQPAEVTTALRLSHLLLQMLVLAPLILSMFIIGRLYYEIAPTFRLMEHVKRAERVIARLEKPEVYGELWSALSPLERARAMPIKGPFDAELRNPLGLAWLPKGASRDQILAGLLRRELAAKLVEDRKELEGLRRTLSRLSLSPHVFILGMIDPQDGPPRETKEEPAEVLRAQRVRDLKRALAHARGNEWLGPSVVSPNDAGNLLASPTENEPYWVAMATILFCPLVWVLWSGLTHGGLTLRLLGLELVDYRGRPASAWRCALRTFLVWLPIVALLGASMTVQAHYPEWTITHWGLWWLAVMLLAVYIVVSVLFPARGLHDWLTGVHLMPK
jgi:uncharacterized RDD family membrane protein YckC